MATPRFVPYAGRVSGVHGPRTPVHGLRRRHGVQRERYGPAWSRPASIGPKATISLLARDEGARDSCPPKRHFNGQGRAVVCQLSPPSALNSSTPGWLLTWPSWSAHSATSNVSPIGHVQRVPRLDASTKVTAGKSTARGPYPTGARPTSCHVEPPSVGEGAAFLDVVSGAAIKCWRRNAPPSAREHVEPQVTPF